MRKKPNIICAGILDTKGEEIKFLAEEVKKYGGNPIIMELSLGSEVKWADISISEILKENNLIKESIFKISRTEALQIVGKAGVKKIQKLYKNGKVDGIIGWAGSLGTTLITMIMRSLPIGVPKIMLSTCASGNVSQWLGNSDIFIINPISEKGINRVTRRIIANASSAIVNMSKVRDLTKKESKPLCALTMVGTTTLTVNRCAEYIRKKGFDTITIHQVGTGATMEDLIRDRLITAVYDISIGEIINTYFDSPFGISKEWLGERLTAASDVGIPQVVCPGGLESCSWGPIETVPKNIFREYLEGKRVSYKNSKKPFIHNSTVTVISLTLKETKLIAKKIINNLNTTKGPTALVIPMRGWSSYDQPKELTSTERGWAKEKGDGPTWWPDTKNPKWSLRATTAMSVFKKNINISNSNLELINCDCHMLDNDFIDFLNKIMNDMVNNKWVKGKYRF